MWRQSWRVWSSEAARWLRRWRRCSVCQLCCPLRPQLKRITVNVTALGNWGFEVMNSWKTWWHWCCAIQSSFDMSVWRRWGYRDEIFPCPCRIWSCRRWRCGLVEHDLMKPTITGNNCDYIWKQIEMILMIVRGRDRLKKNGMLHFRCPWSRPQMTANDSRTQARQWINWNVKVKCNAMTGSRNQERLK